MTVPSLIVTSGVTRGFARDWGPRVGRRDGLGQGLRDQGSFFALPHRGCSDASVHRVALHDETSWLPTPARRLGLASRASAFNCNIEVRAAVAAQGAVGEHRRSSRATTEPMDKASREGIARRRRVTLFAQAARRERGIRAEPAATLGAWIF